MTTRRSPALVGIALCSGGNNNTINADPSALALATPYVRPKVPDAGAVAVTVDQATSNDNIRQQAAFNTALTGDDHIDSLTCSNNLSAMPGFNGGDLQHGSFQVALFAHYSDPKVDQLLATADGELDWTKRVQELQQADQLIAQDDFTLPLFVLPEFAVTDGSISATDQAGKLAEDHRLTVPVSRKMLG